MPYWLSSRVGLRSTLAIVNRFIPGRVAIKDVRAHLYHTPDSPLHAFVFPATCEHAWDAFLDAHSALLHAHAHAHI